LRARLAKAREDLAGLQAELKSGFSKALAAVLREKEAEEEAVGRELQEELARSVRPAAGVWEQLPGLVELIATAEDPDSVRLRLRVALARLVSGIVCLPMKKGAVHLWAAQVRFTGSQARRDYLIAHRPAGNGRPGWTRTASFATAGVGEAELDLRHPSHVKRLERALTAIDPDGLVG
jgi:hypothetical protein